MYISRVRLENIRGFSGPRTADLTLTRPDGTHAGWTVVAGRNGSGKTSLLRAIALAVSGPVTAHSLMPDFQSWVTLGQSEGVSDVHLISDPEADLWASEAEAQPDYATLELRWHADRSSKDPKRRDRQPVLRGSSAESALEGPWDDNPAGWFCAGYGPFRRLVGGSTEAQRLRSTPGRAARLASLFYEDASLTEGVGWLVERHLMALEGDGEAEALKNTALKILSDGLLPDRYEIADVDSSGLWVIDNGHSFPLREMSDGYRTVAALAVDILKQLDEAYFGIPLETSEGTPVITSPGVVIIDEVDAHLHVSWQKRIGGWLKTHFPNIQFIVTTHSPYICQSADPGGLIRLPGPHEDEPPHVVDQELYDRIVFGSGEDAVLSDLFGLDSPYSEQADELRSQAVALESKVAADRASEKEIADYLELRRRLNSSPATRAKEVQAFLS